MASDKMKCPFCHVALVRIQSKQPATLGEWYLVCPYNIKVRILDIGHLTLSLAAALIDAF
jgi:hypothetical protein